MGFIRIKQTFFVTGMLFFCFAQPAFGAIFDYGDYDGIAIEFLNVQEETSGDAALYGVPTIIGDNSIFFPTNFASTANDGASEVVTGALNMTLKAKEDWAISKVIIREFGNYSLTGTGSSATNAGLNATFSVGGQTDAFSVGPHEGPGPLSGDFSESTEFDFSTQGLIMAEFTLTNTLFTNSESGTTAYIDLDILSEGVQVEFYTHPVPIPGAALLFATGGLFTIIGRWRSRRR